MASLLNTDMSVITGLVNEAAGLLAKSRLALAEMPQQEETKEKPKRQIKEKTVSTDTNAAQAGELYAAGKSVVEVAAAMSITYSKARRLINESGVPVRDASARLKGRTRKINS
jgi:hypothetical protein